MCTFYTLLRYLLKIIFNFVKCDNGFMLIRERSLSIRNEYWITYKWNQMISFKLVHKNGGRVQMKQY